MNTRTTNVNIEHVGMSGYRYRTHEGHEVMKPFAKLKQALVMNKSVLPEFNYGKLTPELKILLKEYHQRTA